jgi:hypothetical protein
LQLLTRSAYFWNRVHISGITERNKDPLKNIYTYIFFLSSQFIYNMYKYIQ